ncbi:hypothetical protein OSB04_020891 [Centaurea solstitialis]|uniref:Uncharacterized protein n=1 Tax=Centaurea solstitialis TaxID=347529 RepID=A0AA38TCT4_9ASTR|nr:hypothetical protein OSB04_020891 [Centaurea solstitialis]
MVKDLPRITPLEKVCEGCVLGKQTKKPFPVGKSKRASKILELMHADLCGPMRTDSTFWAEGVATAVYLLNISPTKAVWDQTPYEALNGIKPSVKHLRIFGCIGYALNTMEMHKLKENEKISRDVRFDEEGSWKWGENFTESAGIQLELNELVEERVNPTALNSSGSSTPTTIETSNLDTSVSETPSGDLSE